MKNQHFLAQFATIFTIVAVVLFSRFGVTSRRGSAAVPHDARPSFGQTTSKGITNSPVSIVFQAATPKDFVGVSAVAEEVHTSGREEFLRHFLKASPPSTLSSTSSAESENPMTTTEFRKLASDWNDSRDRELESEIIPTDFAERMETVFRDKNADEMIRNFAVQHLERYAQERMVRGEWDVDSDEAAAIRAALPFPPLSAFPPAIPFRSSTASDGCLSRPRLGNRARMRRAARRGSAAPERRHPHSRPHTAAFAVPSGRLHPTPPRRRLFGTPSGRIRGHKT